MSIRLEELLLNHCSPALMGAKPSNIVTVRKAVCRTWLEELRECRRQLAAEGIRCRILWECPEHLVMMVYRPEVLSAALSEPERASFLRKHGYERPENLGESLNRLARRMNRRRDGFPHEIGIFLGYPLADVEGFLEQKGENCKFSGYWKVYGDVRQAKALFDCYENCRKRCLQLASLGWGLESIVRKTA